MESFAKVFAYLQVLHEMSLNVIHKCFNLGKKIRRKLEVSRIDNINLFLSKITSAALTHHKLRNGNFLIF